MRSLDEVPVSMVSASVSVGPVVLRVKTTALEVAVLPARSVTWAVSDVAAAAQRDAGTPAAVGLHDGAAERGGAVEDGDGGAGVRHIHRAGNGLRRLVGGPPGLPIATTGAVVSSVISVGRGGRGIAGHVAELRRNLLGAVGPEVARRHGQADAAGGDIRRGDDVRHRMRQGRTTEQQLHRIAGHDRRTQRDRKSRRRHVGDAVGMRGAGVRCRCESRRAAARRGRAQRIGHRA